MWEWLKRLFGIGSSDGEAGGEQLAPDPSQPYESWDDVAAITDFGDVDGTRPPARKPHGLGPAATPKGPPAAEDASADKADAAAKPDAAASDDADPTAEAPTEVASPVTAPAEEAPAEKAAAEEAPAEEEAPSHDYSVGDGVFARSQGFYLVTAVNADGSLVLGSNFSLDADNIDDMLRPAVSADEAKEYEAIVRKPVPAAPEAVDAETVATLASEALAGGDIGTMVGALRELYALEEAERDKTWLEALESAVLGELAHVRALSLDELRIAARADTPAFSAAAADDPAEGAPGASPEEPSGWTWRAQMEADKGIVIGSLVASAHDKDKVAGAVFSLRPISAKGTWHALALDGELAIVHDDHQDDLDSLLEARKKLGKLAAEGTLLVVDKAIRDDAAVSAAVRAGGSDRGLVFEVGDGPIIVKVARDGRKAVLLTFSGS